MRVCERERETERDRKIIYYFLKNKELQLQENTKFFLPFLYLFKVCMHASVFVCVCVCMCVCVCVCVCERERERERERQRNNKLFSF